MKHLVILILVLVAGSVCCIAEAAPAAKVAWTGQTFLDVTYKQADGWQIKMDIYINIHANLRTRILVIRHKKQTHIQQPP